MSRAAIPPGQIRFYDAYKPALQAGDEPYTIKAIQQIDTKIGAALSQAPQASADFWIAAPRFTLDPAEIQSLFPPANASGPYDLILPHIVLKERSLPWERELEDHAPRPANPNAPAYPWCALLVFAEDEIIAPPGSTSGMANPTRTASVKVSEFVASTDPAVLNLGLAPLPGDPDVCRAIHIATGTFTRVVPRLVDLPWLAHVRQVNTDDKATDQALASGWFSVVIANRFPVTPLTGGVGRFVAHLVSLEGYAGYLTDAPTWPAGVTEVRLASLASWAFSSRDDGLDFTALMTNLRGASMGGEDLRLRLPAPVPPPTPGTAAADAASALAQGYAALAYDTRVGDETFAWYHGPFVPFPVAPIAPGSIAFASAAAATVYDPGSGTFDLSYAACWEVGRMLALRDRAYATAQQRSRQALRKTVNLTCERLRGAGPQPATDHAALLAPGAVSTRLARWLETAAAGCVPQPGRAAKPPQSRSPAEPAPPAFAKLSAMLAEPALAATIAAHVLAAAAQSPLASVIDWLAGLRLLEGVPFAHLVPDARMLPAESIRFFHVDANALDALSDGAQSIGLGSSRDAAQQTLARGPIRAATIGRASVRRATSLAKDIAPEAPATDPVAGFLLRSAAVSGWPGLEVKAYADIGGTQAIASLRFARVASDVLLVLYPQLPTRIDVEEPKEGLAFGVEAEWAVDLRAIAGDAVGVQIGGAGVKLNPIYRPGGILRVDAWQAYLAGLSPFAPDSATWGPAAFALQMVSAPERMIFDNGGVS